MESKKTNYHHGDLRAALLNAARKTLEQEGPNALSLRELARQVEVSHTAPYRHFTNRENLLASLAATGFQELADQLQVAEQNGGTLKAMGQAYVQFAIGNPSLYKLMFSPELDRKGTEVLSEAASGAFGLLRNRTDAAENDRSATLAAWALVHGLSQILIDQLLEDEPLKSGQLSSLIESVLGHLQV